MTSWHDLFPAELITAASDTGRPLIISALPGAAELELLDLARPGPAVTIDARISTSLPALLVDLTAAILAQIAPASQFQPGSSAVPASDRLAIAQTFGDPQIAISTATGTPHRALTLERLLAAVPAGTELRVRHAHRLWDPTLLWALRGHAQDGRGVVLTARPWATSSLLDKQAAFFGFAEELLVPATVTEDQAQAFVVGSRSQAQWMLDRVRHGRAAFVELAALTQLAGSPDTAWNTAVAHRAGTVESWLTACQQITPWGARMLQAIATGRGPYTAAPEANPSRVAHALKLLQAADVIFQPARREWACTDPFLAAALAAPAPTFVTA